MDELDTASGIEVPSLPFEGNTITFFIATAIIPALLSLLASRIISSLPSSHRHSHGNASPPDLLTHANNVNGRTHPSIPSTPRYGLTLAETMSENDDSDNEIEDDLTSRELRRLQQSPAFHAFLQKRKRTGQESEESVYSRLRLYRKLKKLHPESFYMLCSPHSLLFFETSDPGTSTLFLEYLLSSLINLAATAAIGWFVWTQAPVVYSIACIVAVWIFCIQFSWLKGRPSAGPLFSSWYEDLIWGHAAPAARVAFAQILETVYLIGTVGTGAVVSLLMRWSGGQSVSEKIVGVRLVVEKGVRLDGR
jgi:hypothetical protein